MFNSRTFKALLAVMVVMILAGAAYAFAAANTVPATKAGDGSGVISGYTVSNVVYNLNATDPSTMDSVDFDLSAAAVTAKIKLVAAGSTWYDCTVVTGTSWTCDTTGVTVSSIDQLRVVATSN
jgi:hypothetical protein